MAWRQASDPPSLRRPLVGTLGGSDRQAFLVRGDRFGSLDNEEHIDDFDGEGE